MLYLCFENLAVIVLTRRSEMRKGYDYKERLRILGSGLCLISTSLNLVEAGREHGSLP